MAPRNFEHKWYLLWWKNHISNYRSPSEFAINSTVLMKTHTYYQMSTSWLILWCISLYKPETEQYTHPRNGEIALSSAAGTAPSIADSSVMEGSRSICTGMAMNYKLKRVYNIVPLAVISVLGICGTFTTRSSTVRFLPAWGDCAEALQV